VECLNPIVYRQFMDKILPILGSYVEFIPHPKSIEGIAPPTEEKLKQYGFYDNNTALVNTIEALENRTTTNLGLTREDVEAIVENGGKKLKKEILAEAQAYTEKLHNNMKVEVLEIQKALGEALEGMQNIATKLLAPSSSQLNEV
jgi:predicted house-cleaning noncanonical NTP pyrophosphatase (MazG superfamily)